MSEDEDRCKYCGTMDMASCDDEDELRHNSKHYDTCRVAYLLVEEKKSVEGRMMALADMIDKRVINNEMNNRTAIGPSSLQYIITNSIREIFGNKV